MKRLIRRFMRGPLDYLFWIMVVLYIVFRDYHSPDFLTYVADVSIGIAIILTVINWFLRSAADKK